MDCEQCIVVQLLKPSLCSWDIPSQIAKEIVLIL